jgi:signal transduction histidine kinase/ActR/RegA family two-component response regulator
MTGAAQSHGARGRKAGRRVIDIRTERLAPHSEELQATMDPITTVPAAPSELTAPDAGPLRQRAEQQLAQDEAAPASEADSLKILHELSVHQIELQLQNEALREVQAQALDAMQRLSELNEHLEERVAERTAELVRARGEAEEASRAKGAFVTRMSHELRTPLTGVLGLIDLSARLATDAQQADWLGKARRSALHLLHVVNDILDLSKIEAQRLVLDEDEFVLGGVLDNIRDVLAAQVADKGLHFDVDVPADLARRAWRGDALHLGQILMNLAGNAVKFTDTGGVDLRVRLVEESATAALLRFEVQDTGIGISAEDQARLFAAFEQADDALARRRGGTGLGLTISRHLARLMGGDIDLQSRSGAGATFGLTVRLRQAGAGATGVAARDSSPQLAERSLMADFPNVRILLAEDNPVNQEVFRAMIERIHLGVDIAENGTDAVALARTTRYALILMDLQMPGLDGIGAARAIRAIAGREEVPIIALTASAFEGDRDRCLEAGMNDHLAKPVGSEVLYGILLKWLRAAQADVQAPGPAGA